MKILPIILIIALFLNPILVFSDTDVIPPQKGMCFVTWDKDRFNTKYSDESLQKLTSIGVEYISICVTYYQEKYNSTKIKATNNTPSDRSLVHVIKEAKKMGLKIMLKPHIDLIDNVSGTYSRSDIGFQDEKDWQKWFKEYKKFILHYAKVAKRFAVDIFCVGTELTFAEEKASAWQDLISEVRKVYPGKLTYAANWDDFKNVQFWRELDYIGIDAYFPLTYKPNPSIEDLKKGWEKWIYEIELWQVQINKPIIFTEIGYPSTPHAPYAPWDGNAIGEADVEIQAKCYRAFFETIWTRSWMEGVYWWKWDTNTRTGGIYNRNFTPQNKPAQDIIEANYKFIKQNSTYAMLNEAMSYGTK